MSSQPWALPRAKARERVRKRLPKRPRFESVGPWWRLLAIAAWLFFAYVQAMQEGQYISMTVNAALMLYWTWQLWLWWQWRQYCRHSGEPFPSDYGQVNLVLQSIMLGLAAVQVVVILLV
jgi:hypothetical protein